MDSFLENNDWARHPGFEHFWRHYAVGERWQKQHMDVVRQMTAPNERNDVCDEPEICGRLSRCEITENSQEIDEPAESGAEMRDFFEKTRKHRENLKEQRKAEKRQEATERVEYVDVQKISVRGIHVESSEHRDANAEIRAKRLKAEQDYGKEAAARIMAMESAAEMRFELKFAENPPLWPNIPFRF